MEGEVILPGGKRDTRSGERKRRAVVDEAIASIASSPPLSACAATTLFVNSEWLMLTLA